MKFASGGTACYLFWFDVWKRDVGGGGLLKIKKAKTEEWAL